MKKKIAVITSLIGAYDSKLLDIDYDFEKYDFICFTNNRKLRSKTWDMRVVEPIIPNNQPKSSYYYKWQPHKVLDHDLYDFCIWCDSSLWQFNIAKFEEYLDKFLKSDKPLYIEKHPSRSTLKAELDANVGYNKDNHDKMKNQVARYFKEGFNDSKDCIMVETGFSFRRFKDPDLIKMSDLLWEEMKPESATKRDQLIFDYAVWKTGFKDKIDLFTFEQKSEILRFADHAHVPERKEKILLCGPWQGEVGWEMFAWVGYLRFISQTEAFDKIVVGCEPESKFMYDDFADQVIMTPVTGVKKGCQLNGNDPFFKIQNIQDKEIRMVRPSMNLCYNILSNLDKQVLIPFNFPEEFKKKYNLNFDEINHALKNNEISNSLRQRLNLPKKNNFKIVVVGGPAEKYINRCLDSIKNQTNINWKCRVILTPSKDKTFEIAKTYESDKISVRKSEPDWFVIKNFKFGLELLKPEDDDIICTVDADDWLANNDVLSTIDRYYMENQNLKLTYGSWQVWPEFTPIHSNCQSYTKADFDVGIRRTVFRGTHFRTMKYEVFKNIPNSEFCDEKGEIYKAAGDVAIMTPALEMVGFENSKFIPEILYMYNRETDFNEDKGKSEIAKNTVISIAKKPKLPMINFEKYKKISLHDRTFPHGKTVMNYDFKGFDSKIEWDRTLNSEVLFFTDFTFKEVDNFPNHKEKYFMMIEPPSIFPEIYEDIKSINNKFTKVFTCSEELLKLGQNYCVYPQGGCWIEPHLQDLHCKYKDVSIIASSMSRTVGHQLRHKIIGKYRSFLDLYGKAYNPIENKITALKDYKFQVVVENCSIKNYFTEKLIDCMVTGTIPIYSGCTNLFEFGFDTSGIIQFETLEDLGKILVKIKSGELNYEMYREAVIYNYEKAKEYMVTENYIYNKYFC